MAGSVIVPDDGPAAKYDGGLTFSVFMTCLVAASGGLIMGYDIGISGLLSSPDDDHAYHSIFVSFVTSETLTESSVNPRRCL